MHRNLFYVFLFSAATLASCKKPDACITASANTVKIGQEITFTDCSTNGKVSKIIFGDDNTEEEDINGTIKHAYTDAPGNYTATINLYNNRDKKKASASTFITVEKPQQAELTGSWRLYKEEEQAMGFSTNIPQNEIWTFNADGTFTVDGGGYTTNWMLNNNTLAVNGYSYRITKLYNGELVLRFDEFTYVYTTYSQYYFAKI